MSWIGPDFVAFVAFWPREAHTHVDFSPGDGHVTTVE